MHLFYVEILQFYKILLDSWQNRGARCFIGQAVPVLSSECDRQQVFNGVKDMSREWDLSELQMLRK